MEKINLVEILKDCPKGMELDCTLYENVEFDYIEHNPELAYPIHCVTKTNGGYNALVFTHNGCNDRHPNAKCVIFPKGKTTWEGFQIPFKVGDKVTHNMGILMNIVHMYWDAECNVIRYDIQSPVDNNYKLKAMLAEHLQPYKEENMKEKLEQITLDIPKGYEFFGINDDNQVVLAKKQLQYPKNYEECCNILGIDTQFCMKYLPHGTFSYKDTIIYNLQKLLVCRDAYWKIAGEEMGLGKPWEPDWNNISDKYCIYIVGRKIWLKECQTRQCILAFPTAKMRDAFKENFDRDIDVCKEFL